MDDGLNSRQMLLEEGIGNEKHLSCEDEPDDDRGEEGRDRALRTEGRGNVKTDGILDLHSAEKASHQEECSVEERRELFGVKFVEEGLALCEVESGKCANRRNQSSKIIKDCQKRYLQGVFISCLGMNSIKKCGFASNFDARSKPII